MTSDQRPLIEVSWEVANKVGGIYTVVSTKAKLLSEHYATYICIGPLFPGAHQKEFTERPAPEAIAQTIDLLRNQGIQCAYGTWNIPGSPDTVLIDARSAHVNWDEIKAKYWEDFEIDTLHAQWDVFEPMQWSTAAGMFIDTYQRIVNTPVLGQFHEWMSGFGGLYCKQHNPSVGTVFTTHATVLGRSMSANTDTDIYQEFDNIDTQQRAQELNVREKHSVERACAQHADVFTTVSHITAIEAEAVLGRTPDIVLPNGIDGEQNTSFEEQEQLHKTSREQLRDFIYSYFFGHHQFDLDNTLIFFTNGRYEYHNKGLDVFTDALGRLNTWMRDTEQTSRVVTFYFIPGDAHGVKDEVLQTQAAFHTLRTYVNQHTEDLKRQVLRHARSINDLSCEQILSDESREHISSLAQNMNPTATPALCTHYIPYEEHDDIISAFKRNGLDNGAEDFVKVIRMPIYLDGEDGLLNMSMEQAAAGAHLGVFASYYEPWGYTPLEAAMQATPAITTDLAGFGRFVREQCPDQDGVLVLNRHKHTYDDIVTELFEALKEFVMSSHEQRLKRRREAKEVSTQTEWQTFIKYYLQAHNDAYERTQNR